MPSPQERERRKALSAQAAQDQAAADQAARAAALAALPCQPAQLLALFDRLDTMLDEGCHHDWRESQAWAKAQGVDWPQLQAWLVARSADSEDAEGERGEVDCDCAVWIYVRPSWTEVLARAAGLSQPEVQLFPELGDVFHEPTPWMACVFFPLLSLQPDSLGSLDSRGVGAGRVHAVAMYDIGNPDLDWLAPELDFDRMQLDWDGERYHLRADLSQLKRLQPLADWHAQALAAYQAFDLNEQAFAGMLAGQAGPWQALQDWYRQVERSAYAPGVWREADKIERAKSAYVKALLSFWVARDAHRATGRFLQGRCYLQAHAGAELAPHGHLLRTPQISADPAGWQKIGSLVGFEYVDGGGDEISLYLSRDKGQVLQRFRWS